MGLPIGGVPLTASDQFNFPDCSDSIVAHAGEETLFATVPRAVQKLLSTSNLMAQSTSRLVLHLHLDGNICLLKFLPMGWALPTSS